MSSVSTSPRGRYGGRVHKGMKKSFAEGMLAFFGGYLVLVDSDTVYGYRV
jgi:hypothetical protein